MYHDFFCFAVKYTTNCDKSESSKFIQLSRSKTVFVEIPGQLNTTADDENEECSCDACLKWRSYYNNSNEPDIVGSSHQPSTVPTSKAPFFQTDKMKNMNEVYCALQKIKSKRHYQNRSRYVLKTGLYKNSRTKGKVSIKR